MAVVINCPGVVAANYTNMRQTFLSEKYNKKINMQDFVKLFCRINGVIKERSRALEIVKNSMLLEVIKCSYGNIFCKSIDYGHRCGCETN